MQFRLRIVAATTTYTGWAAETSAAVGWAMAQARYDAPTAKIVVEHMPSAPSVPPISGSSGTGSLVDDPTPTLGGDLQLAGRTIVGQLEKDVLVIDCGILD